MINYIGNIYLTSEIPIEARGWRNKPEIFNFCRQNTLISTIEQRKWEESLANRQDLKMFGIKVKHDNFENVGVCGLTSIRQVERHAEFSLYIGSNYQGRGYSKLALYSLLVHGFESFNLNKIWGEVLANNKKALFLFSDIFKMQARDGHRMHYYKNGSYVDSKIVDITKDEFLQLKPTIYGRIINNDKNNC